MTNEIIKQILDTDKITKEDLDKKIKDKLKALSGLISEEGAAHIIAGELGIKTEANNPTEGGELKLSDVTPGMRSVSVLTKVLRKYELRTFGEDKSGKVGSLLMGDESGIMRLTFWNDKCDFFEKINEGDIIEVQNAYSKENNGRTEIHMGNSSNCIVNPEGKEVNIPEAKQYKEELKKIKDITPEDNYVDVMATIVQVYDPRFFEVCPECNKRMQIADEGKFKCAEHGEKEPVFNYVMNIFLDDGSDNIRATVWKEQIQNLLGLTDVEVVALKEDTQKLEDVKNDLLGKIIKARAKVKNNEAFNQMELVLYRIDKDPEPKEDTSEPKPESKSEEKAESKEKDSEEKPAKVEEEMVTSDDEELLNVEDIDDEI